jgi:hypothetical protein
MSVSGTSGSAALPEPELLVLESSPGSFGAGSVGNGCSSAAEFGVVVGLGESGGGVDLLGVPGNGNCSAVDGFFASGAGGGQGLVFCVCVWFGSGHGGGGVFWVGEVWPRQVAEKSNAASRERDVVKMAIRPDVLFDTLTVLRGGLL